MDIETLRRHCLALPEVTENLQWGDDLCFKVRGKIFVSVGLGSVPPCVCFKCTPENFSDLTEREDIVPAPYVGRYKWVLVKNPAALSDREWKDFIGQSYAMVWAKSAKSRPSQPKRSSEPSKPRARKRARGKKPS